MKHIIQSLKEYFKSKEKKGRKLLFFESVGDRNTSNEKMLRNLIEILEKNGFKIKNKK